MVPQRLALSLILMLLSACGSTNPDILAASYSTLPVDQSHARTLPGVPHQFTYNGKQKLVKNAKQLSWAVKIAKPGDVITLTDGLFLLDHKLGLHANGTITKPITIRAADSRTTELRFSEKTGVVEGLVVFGKHWIIDGLVISAACSPEQHSKCEHAIHIKTGAEGLIIRNNKIVNFNSAIKGSGSASNNIYANNVRIEHNEIFNTSARMTNNPVTPIDINGGDSWRIVKNSIYDFAKGMGNQVSYGAFLKANSSNGVMDSNWLQCQKNVVAPGARVGLSFGGGGNSPIDSPYCKDSDCSHLHRKGQITNNVVTNCSDVGIYINTSSASLVKNNTLLSTTGIDVRFKKSTAQIIANVLVGGEIRERDEGRVVANRANIFKNVADLPSRKELLAETNTRSTSDLDLKYDICGNQRTIPVIGAIAGSENEQLACLAEFQ